MMWIPLTLFILVFVTAIPAWLFGAVRGGVVLLLLLIIGIVVTYRFDASGVAHLFVLSLLLPIVAVAIGFGMAAGMSIRSKRYFDGVLLLVIPVVLLGLTVAPKLIEEKTAQGAEQFVRAHPEVIATIGDNGKIYPFRSGGTGGRTSLPNRYLFNGSHQEYFLVTVTYHLWTPTFALACVRILPRNVVPDTVNACEQKPSA